MSWGSTGSAATSRKGTDSGMTWTGSSPASSTPASSIPTPKGPRSPFRKGSWSSPPSGCTRYTAPFPSSPGRTTSSRNSFSAIILMPAMMGKASFIMTARTIPSRSNRRMTSGGSGMPRTTAPARSSRWACSWTGTGCRWLSTCRRGTRMSSSP